MENSQNFFSISRSALQAVNTQRRSNQGLRAPLRRCNSLTTQGAPNSMARPSGFENKLSTKSSSLGEIAVSFQLSPPPTSDIRIEDKKHIMDSVIVPEFNIMKISRPRSYSANDAIKEETELALEVNYPTSQNSNFGRVGLSGEVEMSRRRSHSIGKGYSGARGGRNVEKTSTLGQVMITTFSFPVSPFPNHQ